MEGQIAWLGQLAQVLRRPSAAVVLLVGGSSLLALLTTLTFLVGVGSMADAHNVSWLDVFPVDQPEFEELFWKAVRSYVNPMRTVYYLASADAWVLLSVVPVGWYWCSVIRRRREPSVFLLPALTPALVGFSLLSLRLQKIADWYPALAEQGLLNPGASGAAAGESTTTVYVGTLLSLILLFAMFWSRSRCSWLTPGRGSG